MWTKWRSFTRYGGSRLLIPTRINTDLPLMIKFLLVHRVIYRMHYFLDKVLRILDYAGVSISHNFDNLHDLLCLLICLSFSKFGTISTSQWYKQFHLALGKPFTKLVILIPGFVIGISFMVFNLLDFHQSVADL